MHKITLPFLGQTLEIFIANTLKPAKLDELEQIITWTLNQSLHELGLDLTYSSVTRLNDSDINFPVELSPALWQYIATNIEMVSKSQGKINPFRLDRKPLPPELLSTAYELQPEDKVIIRRQPVEFIPAALALPFLFEQIEMLLKNFSVPKYLISYHNMHVARGSDSWEVNLEQPDSTEQLEMVITNETMYMQLHTPVPTVVRPEIHNPFKAPVVSMSYLALIVETSTPLQAKLIASLASDLSNDYQFTNLANEWHCGITLILDDGDIKQFSPNT